MTSAIYDILRRAGYDISVFKRPMSVPARVLLSDVLEHAHLHSGSLGTTLVNIVDKFSKQYHPAVFEEAVTKVDQDKLLKILRRLQKPKTIDELVERMLLVNLYNGKWASTQKKDGKELELDRKGYTVAFTLTANIINTYEYLTAEYLLADFSMTELYAIVDAARTYQLKEIKEACALVKDPTKRSLAYVSKILKDRATTAEYVRHRHDRQVVSSLSKLKEIIDIHNTEKKVFTFKGGSVDAWSEDARIESELNEVPVSTVDGADGKNKI